MTSVVPLMPGLMLPQRQQEKQEFWDLQLNAHHQLNARPSWMLNREEHPNPEEEQEEN